MTRDDFLRLLVSATGLPLFAACSKDLTGLDDAAPVVVKSLDEWGLLLSQSALGVLFYGNTEAPGTSPLNEEHRAGTYVCAACFNPLFDAATKYESGTGWPSFWQPLDGKLGFMRDSFGNIEYHCRRCAGHQGHRFNDGPQPTGKRHCNNGVALQFVPTGEPLPALRT